LISINQCSSDEPDVCCRGSILYDADSESTLYDCSGNAVGGIECYIGSLFGDDQLRCVDDPLSITSFDSIKLISECVSSGTCY